MEKSIKNIGPLIPPHPFPSTGEGVVIASLEIGVNGGNKFLDGDSNFGLISINLLRNIDCKALGQVIIR